MNRTELRHRVLAFIASGDTVQYRVKTLSVRNAKWIFDRCDGGVLGGPETRAVNEFHRDGYIMFYLRVRLYAPRPVSLTPKGRALLSDWDEKYGQVSP